LIAQTIKLASCKRHMKWLPFLSVKLLAFAALTLTALAFTKPGFAQEANSSPIRLQLAWSHQAQFAGVYVAQMRKHFEAEGLDVIVFPGGSALNPINELQIGNADVAISWFNNAYQLSKPDKQVVNIGQIFSGSALNIVCRISAGVFSSKDMHGKKIGVWGVGDQDIVMEMLRKLSIPSNQVELIKQRPDGKDLIDRNVACATAMNYNEYWKILDAGVPASDLIVVEPEKYGSINIEDGLYVMRDRLQDPNFRDQMVRLMRALRKGWAEARIAPTLAAQQVLNFDGNVDIRHQVQMAQSVLELIPKNNNEFGLFHLANYGKSLELLARVSPNQAIDPSLLWTHSIWAQLQKEDGRAKPLTEATRFYVTEIVKSQWFKLLIYLSAFTFALSGTLEGINRNYDLWGRLILALLSGLGGGTLRDIVIGGERLNFFYVKDIVFPTGILLIVLSASIIGMRYQGFHHSDLFKGIKKYTDIIGFAGLATLGAMLALAAGMPWFWAPICGALSCAGGGMLRDVLVNQEPHTFKGVIYEEAAVIGGLILTAGLFISNYFESSSTPVLLTVIFTFFFLISLRLIIYKYNITYPAILGGPKKD
jgi:NitT/TauT family transport system substrate-binding protein